jgi:hypothetical protein
MTASHKLQHGQRLRKQAVNVRDRGMGTVIAHPDSRSRDRADPIRDGDDGLGAMGGPLVHVAIPDVVSLWICIRVRGGRL